MKIRLFSHCLIAVSVSFCALSHHRLNFHLLRARSYLVHQFLPSNRWTHCLLRSPSRTALDTKDRSQPLELSKIYDLLVNLHILLVFHGPLMIVSILVNLLLSSAPIPVGVVFIRSCTICLSNSVLLRSR